MMTTESSNIVTTADFDEFLRLAENQGRHFELYQGMIIEKMPTVEHGFIGLNIGSALRQYLKQNPIGIATIKSCHRLPNDKLNDFMPDIAVVLGPAVPLVRKGPAFYMPDIAVEIKSPDESLRRLREKANHYLDHGTHLVWLVLPAQQIIEVYGNTGDDSVASIDGVLTGEPVLPGFALFVKEVFEG
jgi:Uma2 family endonuclease